LILIFAFKYPANSNSVFSVFDALKENEKEIEDLNHLLNDQYKLRESENKQHQDNLTQLTVGYFNFIIKST